MILTKLRLNPQNGHRGSGDLMTAPSVNKCFEFISVHQKVPSIQASERKTLMAFNLKCDSHVKANDP